MAKKHQYEMGMIGNCAYLSYINLKGNVTWQCWPDFDSSFVFGGLLSEEKGGQFSICPPGEFESKQYYLDNTNVLVTEFHEKEGSFRVIDFAPRFSLNERYHRPLMLFRKIEIISGCPRVKVVCNPMGEYGEIEAQAAQGSNHIAYHGLADKLRLTSNVAKTYILNEKPFVLTEDKYFVLSWGPPFEAPLRRTFEDFLERTTLYWRNWVLGSSIPNIYQKEVIRSALILKLHQFEETGAIIASGTTSLPEHPGSGRNWDYRYCWIRDSYFTLSALISLGQFSEAERYSHYIQQIIQSEEGVFQPVYAINGDKDLVEWEAKLEGYQGNGPVRIGNDAYNQVQYDVFGQMLLSVLPLFTDKRIYNKESVPHIRHIHKILDGIEKEIDSPDAGIWEYRGKMQRHCASSLFNWAGAKAANKMSGTLDDQELNKRSLLLAKKAHDNIEACFDSSVSAYGMSIENKKLNASEFLLINMGFLDPHSKRAKEHLRALEKELATEDNLIYRYRDLDDFGETHSTFLICGFWYAESLARIGRLDDSKSVFERLLKTANHLGIFSEDVDPHNDSQWGNFAQTYSHVGLINAAFCLAHAYDRPSFL